MNKRQISKLTSRIIHASVKEVTLDTVNEGIDKLVTTLDATNKGSMIRNLDLLVREAGLTGTKEHEVMVKAFAKMNDARNLLKNLQELINSRMEANKESSNEESEEQDDIDNDLEGIEEEVESESDDEPDEEESEEFR